MEFDGLTAVVTGGSSGIGAATAGLLVRRGAGVASLGRNPGVPAPGLVHFTCDVSDDACVRQVIADVADRFGGIDIVINNAGMGAQGTIEGHDDEEWHRVFDVNVVGLVRVTRAALPYLRRSHKAAVVNTCSIAATAGLPQRALYSATKGAVLALTKSMAADHLADGVRVNCVNPGTVDTPWIERLLQSAEDPEAELSALTARQPHGRLITADEVAAAIVYLASPFAGSTTGIHVAVDGGMHALRLRS